MTAIEAVLDLLFTFSPSWPRSSWELWETERDGEREGVTDEKDGGQVTHATNSSGL